MLLGFITQSEGKHLMELAAARDFTYESPLSEEDETLQNIMNTSVKTSYFKHKSDILAKCFSCSHNQCNWIHINFN